MELATFLPEHTPYSHDFVVVAGGYLEDAVAAELARKKASPSPPALRHQLQARRQTQLPCPDQSPPHRESGSGSSHHHSHPLLIPPGRSDS